MTTQRVRSWSSGLWSVSALAATWGLVLIPTLAESRIPEATRPAAEQRVARADGGPGRAEEALRSRWQGELSTPTALMPAPDLEGRVRRRLIEAAREGAPVAGLSLSAIASTGVAAPLAEVPPSGVAPVAVPASSRAPDDEAEVAVSGGAGGEGLIPAANLPGPYPSPYEEAVGHRVRREDLYGKLHHPMVLGRLVTPFGTTTATTTKTWVRHTGWTLRAGSGHRVRVAMDGLVVYSGWFRGFGQLVVVDQGAGYHTVYAHLKAIHVQQGEVVQRGAVIGVMGDTGALTGEQLYFELREHGRPVDPEGWFVPPHLEQL